MLTFEHTNHNIYSYFGVRSVLIVEIDDTLINVLRYICALTTDIDTTIYIEYKINMKVYIGIV